MAERLHLPGPARPGPGKPKLLDRLRREARVRRLSPRTEEAYVQWSRRFILFHDKRHPSELGGREIAAFLTHLAVDREVTPSTQSQALNALVFLYRTVLELEMPELDGLVRARKPRRLPVVLTREEVQALLAELRDVYRLIACLLYGSGLRLLECLHLRVKDLDFGRRQIVVRSGKGGRGRAVPLPQASVPDLEDHLARVRRIHARDLGAGFGETRLPGALARKLPRAGGSGSGSTRSPRHGAAGCRAPGSSAATTSTRPPCSAPSGPRSPGPASPSAPAVTRCATASPPTCWRAAATYAPSRSCSAIAASPPR